MSSNEIHVVTGAYGYTGKYIAKRLLDEGCRVRTLTNSPYRANPFGNKIKAYLYNFTNPDKLTDSLKGAKVLYNNYWVRYNYKGNFSYNIAVENNLKLFDAAKKGGIERIVHISITNPSLDSPFDYYRGKAIVEKALIESDISYAILRPTIIFGKEDILINNIAWTIRKAPISGIFGDGLYKLQPGYVKDLAKLTVEQGMSRENRIIDAIGPETFTYKELLQTIGKIIGKNRPIITIPDTLGLIMGWVAGKILKDVILTREEIKALKANSIFVNSPPAGETALTDWMRKNASNLGKYYASELARRRNRIKAYSDL